MPRITLSGDFLNRAYRPHLQNAHRYQIYFGGAGSGKSVFLATRCVLDALSGRNTLIVRQVAKTLRQSCWNEVNKAVSRLKLSHLFSISKTEMALTARNNGAQILFAGLDDVEKIKSLTPARGALTDIWIEEATEIQYRDFKQLDKRLRGISRHPKRLTLSFNPIAQTHWIYREFFSIWHDGKPYAESPQVSILKTTYKDNRFLTAKKIDLTKKMASSLLKDGRSYASGIYSEKTGKTYDAFIVLEDDGSRSSYKLDFTK